MAFGLSRPRGRFLNRGSTHWCGSSWACGLLPGAQASERVDPVQTPKSPRRSRRSRGCVHLCVSWVLIRVAKLSLLKTMPNVMCDANLLCHSITFSSYLNSKRLLFDELVQIYYICKCCAYFAFLGWKSTLTLAFLSGLPLEMTRVFREGSWDDVGKPRWLVTLPHRSGKKNIVRYFFCFLNKIRIKQNAATVPLQSIRSNCA